MKNQSGSRIVNVVKSIFNVRRWSDFDRMKAFTVYLGDGFKKMFVPQRQQGGQTFEEAMSKYHLTEADLIQQQKALYRLSILMCAAAFLIFSYAVFNIFYGSIIAMLISLVVTLIALSLAFRYHFWYYQIKVRKLGCSFKEWYRQGFLGDKQ